jgi:hypothetical protein
MSFTKITTTELNSRGATTLPNQPAMSATALKQEFDAPAKNIVAPKFNNLVDELEATTAAASLGAVAPTGRIGNNVQGVMNSISSDLDTLAANTSTAIAEAHAHPNKALLDDYTQTEANLADAVLQKHSHSNKAVIDKFADDGTGLTYDGNPIRGAVESVNGKDGTVVLTASDVGALPNTTPIPTKTSDLTNDSGFITASSLPTRTSQLTNDSGFITSGDIPTIPSKTSDLTNDSNFVADASYVHTDNNYDATAKAIVDGATAAIAAKSTVAWNQNITTGQKIATVTIDGTPTDVYAPTGGGGGGGAVDSVNGQTGIVTLGVDDLDDVSISSLGSQQTIVYDGTEWGNEPLADVALSGSYNDLTNKPNLATVATSGSYADLSNKPSIPAAVAVKGDSESTYRTGNVNLTKANIGLGNVGNFKAVSTVASQGLSNTEKSNARANIGAGTSSFSGSYNDLSNKPTIPTVDQTYSATSINAQSGKAVAQALSSYEQPLVKNAGSKTWNDLITNASTYLTASNTNKFYRLSTAGAVTSANQSLFVDGIVEGEHFSVDSHIAVVEVNGSYKYDYFGGGIEPEVYFESSGNSLSYTFTHDAINENSTINLYSNIVGDKYTNISVSEHTCTVTMAVAQARTLTIYVK